MKMIATESPATQEDRLYGHVSKINARQTGVEPTLSRQSFQELVDGLAVRLKVDACNLYAYAPNPPTVELVATQGLDRAAIGHRFGVDRGLTGRVAREGKPLSVKHPQRHPDYYHIAGSNEEAYQSYLGIPLMEQARLLGVLVVQTIRPKVFLLSEIEQIHLVGREVVEILLGRTRY